MLFCNLSCENISSLVCSWIIGSRNVHTQVLAICQHVVFQFTYQVQMSPDSGPINWTCCLALFKRCRSCVRFLISSCLTSDRFFISLLVFCFFDPVYYYLTPGLACSPDLVCFSFLHPACCNWFQPRTFNRKKVSLFTQTLWDLEKEFHPKSLPLIDRTACDNCTWHVDLWIRIWPLDSEGTFNFGIPTYRFKMDSLSTRN